MTKFSKQHYLEIGSLLKRVKATDSELDEYVKKFKADNPRFDEGRFRAYVRTNADKVAGK